MEQRIRDELNILRDTIVRSIPVERIYLFGSYANGNVVVGKRNRFDQRSTAPTIERQIAAEGVVLYG